MVHFQLNQNYTRHGPKKATERTENDEGKFKIEICSFYEDFGCFFMKLHIMFYCWTLESFTSWARNKNIRSKLGKTWETPSNFFWPHCLISYSDTLVSFTLVEINSSDVK